MAVLYRKYRPQTFAQVVSQKAIIKTLQNQIAGGSFAHAYLFTGSRGVGKTSVARIFAKAVNCLQQQPSLSRQEAGHLPREGEKDNVQASPGSLADACGECAVCKAIENNNFIDLIEIDAASNTGVDNVRDIIDHVKFSPSIGKYKVFIIDEVHMLSKGAFNALLKTLEEPPKHAVFILATTEIQKVPATIISRTQRFDFKALPAGDIKEHLKFVAGREKLNYEDEILDLVAQNSSGSVRDALSILDKISTLGSGATGQDIRAVLGVTDAQLLSELFSAIARGKASDLPAFFDRLMEQGADFGIFNKDFLEYLRVMLVKKITQNGQDEQLALVTVNDLIFIIRLFLKSFKDLQGTMSPEIPMLLASVEAAMRKSQAPGRKAEAGAQILAKDSVLPEASNQIQGSPKKTLQPEINVSQKENISYQSATLEEVRGFWPTAVSKIKDQNGPLGSMLKAAALLGVDNGRIILQVKYQFDKKTLEKNSAFISSVIFEVSGKNLGLVGNLPEGGENPADPVAALSDALKLFGGEIIE